MASQTQDAIFSCPGTVGDCTDTFAHAFSFEVVETISNGDCFFDSLLQSGKIYKPAKSSKEQTHQRLLLRKRLVDYLENPDILASLSEFGFNDIKTNIQQLRKEKVYRCDAGDLPTQFAHEAFGVNLHVYVINYHERTKRTVVTLERHPNIDPMAPTIHVLRIGEHFKLLDPQIDLDGLDKRIQQGIKEEKKYYNARRHANHEAADKIKVAAAAKKEKNAASKKKNAASANLAKGKTKKSPLKNTNENIMKRMMELSLKTAQNEEEKRQTLAKHKQEKEKKALAKMMANLNNHTQKKKQEKENAAIAKMMANLNVSQPTKKISKLNSALIKLSSGKTYENLNRYEKTSWTKFQKNRS